jgi:hypothetical protein
MCLSLHVHHTELTDQPGQVIVVASGAAGWWHDDPAAQGVHEVADVVVGEFVARIGQSHGVLRTADNAAQGSDAPC